MATAAISVQRDAVLHHHPLLDVPDLAAAHHSCLHAASRTFPGDLPSHLLSPGAMGSPTAHATNMPPPRRTPGFANMSLSSASAPRLALERAQSYAAAPRRPRRYLAHTPSSGPVLGPSWSDVSEITPAATREEVARRRDRLPGAGGDRRGHCRTAASPPGTATRTASWQRVQSETFMARISCGRVDTTSPHTSFAADDAAGSGHHPGCQGS